MDKLLLWAPLIGPALAALVAVVGLGVSHWLTSRRELKNKRRETRLKGLELAFVRISNFNKREWTDENKLEFENFVTEIQLFGTPKQIQLMSEIVLAFVRRESEVSLDALLEDLRNTIRAELRLERESGPIWWYRFKLPDQKTAQQIDQADSPAAGGPAA
jgi:hypothetical protein